MSLLQQTQGLHDRITALLQARGQHDETKALDELRQEKVEPCVKRLQDLLLSRVALADRDVPHQPEPLAANLATQVSKLKSRFEKAPAHATLVAARAWPAVQPLLDAFAQAAQQAALQAWGTYCQSTAPSSEPTSLRQDYAIGLHPENQPILREYEAVFRSLERSSSSLPRDVGAVDDFIGRCTQAHTLLRSLNRVLPPPEQRPPADVAEFLRRTQIGAVGLEHVSASVLDWLRSANRLGEFEVWRKGT